MFKAIIIFLKCPLDSILSLRHNRDMNNTNTLQHHNQGDSASLAEAENAIEIAMNCLESLQDNLDIGRDAIIRNFILPWAREAEAAWQTLQASDTSDDTPYYDFIDAFAAKKESEILNAQLP